jgi:hypothetical protein
MNHPSPSADEEEDIVADDEAAEGDDGDLVPDEEAIIDNTSASYIQGSRASVKIQGGFGMDVHVPSSSGLDATQKNKEFFRRMKEVKITIAKPIVCIVKHLLLYLNDYSKKQNSCGRNKRRKLVWMRIH